MKRSIATLLSLSMVLSITSQTSLVRADENIMPQPLAAEEAALDNQTAEQTEQSGSGGTDKEELLTDVPAETVGREEALTDISAEADEEAFSDVSDEAEENVFSESTETEEQTELLQEEEQDTEEELEEIPEDESEAQTPENISGIEVVISGALPLEKHVPFTVTLQGSTSSSKEVILPAGDENSVPITTTSFSGLENGTYDLMISGAGFATYTQQIEVDNLVYNLQLYTDFQAGFAYDGSSAHPGVLLIGDIDGDGLVNDSDVDRMTDALESENDDLSCDMNGDGIVDLTDLQMLSGSVEESRETMGTLTTRIPSALIQASISHGSFAAGSMEALLDGKSVSLSSQDGSAITEENPVSMTFDFTNGQDTSVIMEGIVISSPVGSPHSLADATVTVEYEENGTIKTAEFPVHGLTRAANAVVQKDGSVVVNFGSQIAVKKVSITVTATSGGSSLAEITKVEFLNDMESRIPAPEMNIPENVQIQAGNKTFTVTWDPAVNVTGYEVLIRTSDKQEILRTAVNKVTVNQFAGEKLVNNTSYTVQVQAINGEWRSGYGEAVIAVPKPDSVPPAPDGLSLTGRYQRIDASWKNMKDTDGYNLYYRKSGNTDFTKVEVGNVTKYTINNLDTDIQYEVYVTGINELGEGPASVTAVARTVSVNPVKMPEYGLINTSGKAGELTAHIESVTHKAGYMKDSPLDSGDTALGVVDNDFASWYGLDDWDDGAAYPDNGGIRVNFDGKYNVGSISLTQSEDRGYYGNARVFAKNEKGNEYQIAGTTIVQRTAENGRKYYTIKIPGGVTTNYLRVCVGYTYLAKPVSISEMRFYQYDSLEDDILALYADDLHLTLNDDVTEEILNDLQTRLDTPDPICGEYHPERLGLQVELDNARGLLEKDFNDVTVVSTNISSARDSHLGFTGLNAWQPLGVTVHAGEEIVVYVGSNNRNTGDTASVQLIATQYYADYDAVASKPIQLKVGRNEITIPELESYQSEHGGALYVQYTGNNASDKYSVRVSGGVKIPTLNLYGITDSEERMKLVTTYVRELENYVENLEKLHNSLHKESGISAVDYDYNREECILNTTDILLDQMMLSVPAQQILEGLSQSTTEERAKALCDSLDAMDQMMILFYQHKGLTNLNGAGNKNRLPSQHLNIRYQRMFAGAFMYAAGNHIGIGWGSVPGLSQGKPIQINEDGSYLSGNFFGWGIAHEIGHEINQNSYVLPEVTNNYFSQISQASEGVRFSYREVYEKVTSGTTGHSDNVFTQLALYWQLHLAYDTGYEYEIYDSYEELLQSRFFARVDTYARDTASAPAPGGISLTLGGNSDQNLMRLACAAAERDLTDFFARWGIEPDETTAAYAAQFDAETRALYYGDDLSRDYRMVQDESYSIKGQDVISDRTTVSVNEKTPNQVELSISSDMDSDLLLGYEITRMIHENGEIYSQVVGFTTDSTFTDTVTTINNRSITYQVTAVDQFLNRSAAYTLPAVKISHDGSYDKSFWTLTTNMVSEEDITTPGSEEDPCEPEPVSAISSILDNDKSTTYTGKAEQGDAIITVDFHKSLAVTGFKYTVTEGTPIGEYEIQISTDGTQWTTLADGSFAEQEVNTVYFRNENNDPWVCTYDANQLRLIVKSPAGSEISISEIDLLGPTGDNIELLEQGIGYLEQDYRYGMEEGDVIPAGSLVFNGSYKGNPAYNVVLLYDQNGNIVGGTDADGNVTAQQIILAEVPDQGELGEVSEGGWIYWITPDQLKETELPKTVRAELYRVDNAITNEGQRLTSDTLMVTLPEKLPGITIQSG